MKKKIIFILLILLITISIMGCNQKTPKEPPEISITIGDKEIETINSEERQRMDLYVQVMKAAFLEENGGDDFIAVDLETLEGLSIAAKKEVLNQLANISPNVYDLEEVKDDVSKFIKDDSGRLIQSIDGTQLWIEIEEYSEEKVIITGVSWFGNLGAVFPKYEAIYKDGKWELKLISMAIS